MTESADSAAGNAEVRQAETEDAVLSYIRRHRQRYPRVQIQKQLLLAGHEVATIDAALSASDAELRANSRRRNLFDYVWPAIWVIGLTYGASQVLQPVAFWILLGVVAVVGSMIAVVLYMFSHSSG